MECDLENQSTIKAAIANASIVTCCIGASEKEVFDITGPYRIDYKATSNLIQEGKNSTFSLNISFSLHYFSDGPYSFLSTEVKQSQSVIFFLLFLFLQETFTIDPWQ